MSEILRIAAPAVAVVVGAFVVTKVSGIVVRRLVRRVADAAREAPSRFWRTRVARVGSETDEMGERRRRQRVDAAARGVNHLVALVVWIVASIAIFHMLDVDAAFFLSSAGFLGAGLSIGGQHKVHDYFTGLSVLFEDRYGVGDDIHVSMANTNELRATVEHVGLLTTRLRDAHSTYHVANGQIHLIRNHSQDPARTRLQVKLDATDDESDRSHDVLSAVRRQAGSSQLTEVFFVGDLAAHHAEPDVVNVDLTTIKPLDERTKSTLVRRAEADLRAKG
jgi:small-conductance mechanosensitive channel